MPTSRYLAQPTAAPSGRQLSQNPIFDLRGLNSTDPYDVLQPYASPFLRNARMYDSENNRQTAISTRKGPEAYSVPIGETQRDTETSTSGAANQTISTVGWKAQKFTASADGRLTKIELNLKSNDGTGHILVAVYSDVSDAPGALLGISSILSSDVASTYGYIPARFASAPVAANGTDYWVVAYIQDGGSGTYHWSSTTNSTDAKTSNTSGNTWSDAAYSLNFKTYISTDGGIKGITRYTPTSGVNQTIFAHGTNLYSVNDTTGATTSIKSGLSSSATQYRFAKDNDKLYIANGFDRLMEYNGTAVSDNALQTIPSHVIAHKNRIWIIKASEVTRMEFSNLADDTVWESTNFIYIPSPKSNDPVKALHSFQDTLVCMTRNNKYVLYGSDLGDFNLKQALGKEGTRSQESSVSDENFIYFVGSDGMYRWNGSRDEKISLPIQADIDEVADLDDIKTYLYEKKVHFSFKSTGQTRYDSKFVFDTDYNEWFYDTGTYTGYGIVLENGQLVEGSDSIGALYYGDRQYSDLGSPIDFQYWTKYWNFGYSDNKKQVRRLYLHLRSQSQPFSMTVGVDKDFVNSPEEQSVALQGTGSVWGEFVWGEGIWGKTEYIHPKINIPGQGIYFQVRFSKTGVDTPVDLIGYNTFYRLRRPR